MKRFFKSFKSDRGDSLVSFIIVVPVLLMILITSVDYGIFMLNRGQIQAVARDAARTVAIYGGNGDASKDWCAPASVDGVLTQVPAAQLSATLLRHSSSREDWSTSR